MKWFKHDSDASMDAKLQDVLLEYGAEGYGLYWYCLELIAGSVTSQNLTFELEHDARIIARNLGLGVQRVEEMMRHMVDLGLFEESQGRITCLKMANRADDFTRKAITKKPHNPAIDGEVGQSRTKSEKVPLEDRSKKIEVRKEDRKSKRFAPPTLSDLNDYVREKTGGHDPLFCDRFFNHYESNGWKVGRNPMKSWKAAVNQWLARNQEQNGENSQRTHRSQREAVTDATQQPGNW